MEINSGKIKINLNEQDLHFTVEAEGEVWSWSEDYIPTLVCGEDEISFASATSIEHNRFTNGIGCGIESRYEGFTVNGQAVPYAFETLVWVETSSGRVRFEWLPLCEEGLSVQKVMWPGAMDFSAKRRDWYTLLNVGQGLLLPNDWPVELGKIPFDGFFGTEGSYMPWFAQVRGQAGYIAICETPWNAGWQAVHPADGPYSKVSVRFEQSLGKMDYRRVMQYSFYKSCDYTALCKVYRAYVREMGGLCTLNQKAAKTPSVDKLIGCSFVHTGIKTHVAEDSNFFDPEQPEKNNRLVSFAQRAKEVEELHELGVEKLYLHLDGWAQPGYDNCHPDYSPACREAGDWEGMRTLADRLHEHGYLFGIHDQYRDYYLAAPSYDERYACRLPDGSLPGHRYWAGGPQNYLCATQAPYYVRRNFAALEENGVELDCAYLDVFTCNEGDECANPLHIMTRRDCYELRRMCFEYLLSRNILPSSEEVSDWSIPSLVFCHYAPYEFMLRRPGAPRYGLAVPLFSLVYHDCVIVPWMMEENEGEDLMLYALINGGAPYLIRDGAYPGTDGSFASEEDNEPGSAEERRISRLRRSAERCAVVSKLHRQVAKLELMRHELLCDDGRVQRSVFSDGTVVTVNFNTGAYDISAGK